MQALFPDNTYGVDSGGDPQVIPKLTFEEFKVCSFFMVEKLTFKIGVVVIINFHIIATFALYCCNLVLKLHKLICTITLFIISNSRYDFHCEKMSRSFTVDITIPAMPGYGFTEMMIHMSVCAF